MNMVNISISDTGNAAFVDIGKQVEVSRILKEAALQIRENQDYEDITLRDVNGNNVGSIGSSLGNGRTDVQVKFVDPDDAEEVARLIDEVAERVEQGNTEFVLRDINGNKVGDGSTIEWAADNSLLDLNGEVGVDIEEALRKGKVYLADGIEEGAFRYVVPTDGFEPGYGQSQGDAWLVDARGVVAPGYEDTRVVREVEFKELPRSHRDDLIAVQIGTLNSQEFERKYGDAEDLEP